MGENTQPTNSTKFAPMPVSALLANIIKPEPECADVDSSYTSIEDSDESFSTQVATKIPQSEKKDSAYKQKTFFSSTPNYKIKSSTKKITPASTQKSSTPNYKIKSSTKKITPASTQKSIKKTPLQVVDTNKDRARCLFPGNQRMDHSIPQSEIKDSAYKQKTVFSSTPTYKIKSSTKKITPASTQKSIKKTPLQVVDTNKDRARCLFPDNHQRMDHSIPQPHKKEDIHSVPETPLNGKLLPPVYAATPSYPQGVVGGNNNSKMTLKATTIKGKNYIYIKKLGTGGSSEVYKVIEVGTSCEYAVKCVDLATDKELAQGYINEVRLLRDLQNSDRVIRLYEYEYDRANQFLRVVLEAGETDLSSLLRARGAGLPPALVLHYWEEMLHAVHYIHDHGVIHADLKPANFLLVCGKLKLIDFGIASRISSDATSVVRSQAAGTYSYISPEALMGGAGGYGVTAADGSAPIKISFRSDVWSLGCILYSMVYGRTPFSHIANLAKLAAILDPNHKIDYPPADHLPATLLSALKWCLTYNAKSRPSVRELLSIPYLQTARSHLPSALLDKLRPLVSPQEFRVLQRAQL